MTALLIGLGLTGTALLGYLVWLVDPSLRRAVRAAYWNVRMWLEDRRCGF